MSSIAIRVLLLVSLGALLALPAALAAPVVDGDDVSDSVTDSSGSTPVTESSLSVQNITDSDGNLVGYYFEETSSSSNNDTGVFGSVIDFFSNIFTSDNDKHRGGNHEHEGAHANHTVGHTNHTGAHESAHHEGGQHANAHHEGGQHESGSQSNIPAANGIHGAPPHAGNANSNIPAANGIHGAPPSISGRNNPGGPIQRLSTEAAPSTSQ